MKTDVTESRSWQKLQKLAESPYDLIAPGALDQGGRFASMICQSAGLRLFYAAQRVDGRVIEAFQEFADEHRLVERFKEMRRGAVINKILGWESENRQVLHTSSRDIFTGEPKAPESAKQANAEFEKLKTFLGEVDRQGEFTTMVNVGIGGSDLGPRAVYEALKADNVEGRKVYFIANVDPDDAARVLDLIEPAKTLVTVVSKSGSTLETRTNEELVRSRYESAGLDPARYFVAVTGKGSPMDNPHHYLRSFYMYDYIGGRYSVSSMVGCVSLGFALGAERLEAFLKGAAEMDEACETTPVAENMALLLALLGIWNHNFLGYPTLAVLPYSQALHRFPAHLQQCDMESNGKSITVAGLPVSMKTGPVVWGEPGTNGQHAFYQLLHQGTEIVPAEFIGFLDSQYGKDITVDNTTSQQKLLANLMAQVVALATGRKHENPNKRFGGNRPSSMIIGRRLDPRNMGRLLALYEAKIVFQGFCWNINSFDQEGVQLGKVLADRFLEHMKSNKKCGTSIEEQFLGALEN
ncbi:MAG: glucose-6-phosphate isomerase [Desulfocapsaceae bacterium]